MTNTTTRTDVQQLVTDTIIQQLEQGTIPWQKPWKNINQFSFTIPKNFHTQNHYRGINIILLWAASIKNKFQSNEWGSFKQWAERKEYVRKGEKGNLIVYYDTFEREVDDEIKKIPYLKSYYVFNKCQLQSFQPEEPKGEGHLDVFGLTQTIEIVEEFVDNTDAIIEAHDGGACYIPSHDKILMPYRELFQNSATCTATEAFYSTLLHELTHWSGAKHRLDRLKSKKFGDSDYAFEELTAEFGAAFLCAELGLNTVDKGDHASYIENWLKALKNDKTLLFTASSQASKAVDYLKSFSPD